MQNPIAQVRDLTGVPEDAVRDTAVQGLFAVYGHTVPLQGCVTGVPPAVVRRVAADVAARMGASLIGTAGVTAVEDISIDARRPVQAWWDLADRLRAEAENLEALADDDGPFVVPYRDAGRAEATEWMLS